MRKMKGSVLVQVLMTAVIVSIIAAGMMHLLLLRSQAIKRGQDSTVTTATTNSGLDAILAIWSKNGGVNCSGTPAGFTATVPGTPGGCNCTYSDGKTIITATATSSGGGARCGLSINSKAPL
ncbi:MAG: hypothetical protein NTY77_00455 [Elusimicrobia bacterium]|nr:hypothetical protein [Elusimicrobiota bacterium]